MSCSNSRTEKPPTEESVEELTEQPVNSEPTELSEPIESTSTPEIQELTTVDSLKLRADSSDLHFHFNFRTADQNSIDFFSGYEEYDEDKYGFQNPAYLRAFIDEELVFQETFEAYESHWMNSAGSYVFADTLNFFKLNYGLEAHDYVVAERLIAISNNSIQTVCEYDFQSTGYASRFPEYVYPSDSGGVNNTIILINRVVYRTGEEPNLADTTLYEYINAEFKKRGS